MATTPSTPSTKTSPPAHISFYDRVSPPGDILETMVVHASIFMQHARRSTLREDDVRQALDFLKISVDESKAPPVEANDEIVEFRKRVRKIFNDKIPSAHDTTKTAASLLKLVETEYQKKENFKASPHKKGRLLVLESPTGVTAKCLEFDVCDDTSIVMEDDEDDDEWDTTQEANDIENNNESDDESIIRRGMVIDEEWLAESDEEE